MTKELKVMLDELTFEEGDTPPEEVEYRTYIECPMCNRRLVAAVFEGKATCNHCRGLNSYGIPVKKYTPEEG